MTLNEIFVTKMCHDLAGSIGTLNNTTELLDMDPSFAKDATALLKQSASVLVARLKFFRVLLGLETEITSDIAQNYLATLPMNITVEGAVSSRLHLVFIMLAGEILIRGGMVQLTNNSLICSGTGARLDPIKKAILLEEKAEFAPQYASVLWLRVWMKENNMRAEIFQNEDTLTIQFIKA